MTGTQTGTQRDQTGTQQGTQTGQRPALPIRRALSHGRRHGHSSCPHSNLVGDNNMAFLDDLLSNARWLDQYLGTQTDQNPNLTADEAQRSPKAAQANAQSVADWLRANGLLGAGPQGTSSGLLRPNANGASGVDESGFNLAYPGPTQLPTAAAPTAQQGPIPGGPSYMGNPFGGAVQVPTAGVQPETIDISAAPKRPLPVQPLPRTMPQGAVNPDQVLPSPATTRTRVCSEDYRPAPRTLLQAAIQ